MHTRTHAHTHTHAQKHTPHGTTRHDRYTVGPDSVRKLQQSILDVSGTTALQGTELIEALEAHFFAQFNVKLSAMTLTRVGTYAAFVGSEGP